jgi:predicted DNA-binding transcriptional regulator YafY
MNDTLMRQWAMLRAIPRPPRRIGAPALHARLADLGMKVTLRTVQRDLNALAKTFPLEFDESKPQGWWWREAAGQFEIPCMDAHAALTFNLVEQYMQNLLPRSTLSHMTPWFKTARSVVQSQASSVTQWREKLRIIPNTLNKVPTPIDPAIQAKVYTALLEEKQIELTYRAITSGKEAKTYAVHPLGLIVMEQAIYLLCTVKDYQDPRFLALHRIDEAEVMQAKAVKLKGFAIDEFITREFGIRLGKKPMHMVLRVRGVLAKYLVETPLTLNQVISPIDGEWTRIEANVPDTIQVRNWVRSLGTDAVVEAPEMLRAQMKAECAELGLLYESSK